MTNIVAQFISAQFSPLTKWVVWETGWKIQQTYSSCLLFGLAKKPSWCSYSWLGVTVQITVCNSIPLSSIPLCFVQLSSFPLSCIPLIIIIYPLTARAVGAPQMFSQPVSSVSPCSPLHSGTWRSPGLFIPWCCLPISSSVCLVFFPLLLWLAKWFWPDLMNGKYDHIAAMCVSLPWSGGLRVVRLPAGSWHWLPRW